MPRSRRSAAPPLRPEIQSATEAVYLMERLNRAIKTVHSSMEKIMQQAAGSDDLTLMHWCVLVRLLEDASCEQAHLRSHTGITAPHLTKLLDDLVARDLVRRDRCPRDRRKFLLALTQAGRAAGLSLLTSLDGFVKGRKLVALGEFHQLLKALVSITGDAEMVGNDPISHP